jgi:predicted enzyme related to lactoylglutathione lyase
MLTFLGLRTCIYHVPDLDKAKEWYSAVLMTQPYFDQPFYVGFDVGGFELGLDPNMKDIVKGNNVDTYWGIDDCKGEYARLLDLGATEHHAPQDVGEGIIVATVLDPFGNVFGIIENPKFGKVHE